MLSNFHITLFLARQYDLILSAVMSDQQTGAVGREDVHTCHIDEWLQPKIKSKGIRDLNNFLFDRALSSTNRKK